MKQKDIALIIAVAVGSAVIAFFVSSKIIVTPAHRQQKVEVTEVISTEFPQPDNKYFNGQSIDPTKLIQIGNNSNTTPFNSATQ